MDFNVSGECGRADRRRLIGEFAVYLPFNDVFITTVFVSSLPKMPATAQFFRAPPSDLLLFCVVTCLC